MHLTIISGASRSRKASNTAKIIAAFREGFQSSGGTAEVWYLSDRAQWDGAKSAFQSSEHILFALPLYVEGVPGVMLEFLESLPPKPHPGACVSFLLQGGFPEASQSRCCEAFLKTLPGKLGCEYAGTLIRGDMFGLGLVGDGLQRKMVAPFVAVGRQFATCGRFDTGDFAQFTSPEFLSERQLRQFEGAGRLFQRWFMGRVARRLGCKEKLDAKPYDAGCGGSRR